MDLQEIVCEMHGLDLSGSRQGQMAGSCECHNELSSSIKCFSRRALLNEVRCVKWVGFHDVSRWTKSVPESIIFPDSTLFGLEEWPEYEPNNTTWNKYGIYYSISEVSESHYQHMDCFLCCPKPQLNWV